MTELYPKASSTFQLSQQISVWLRVFLKNSEIFEKFLKNSVIRACDKGTS